jgi:lipopolysaccharide assembly outer membrane protein LptD (OstA)
MKNNAKIIIFLFFSIVLIGHNKTYSSEIQFTTSEINITDNGNTTNTGPGSAYSEIDNIKIDGQSFKFDKISSILIANNANAILSEENIEIQADVLLYDQKFSIIRALGNVEIKDLTHNITLNSEEAIYKKNDNIIISNTKSTFIDKVGNNLLIP